MTTLATLEDLFRTVFFPLYPPEAARDLARARTLDRNPAKNPHVLAHLKDAARIFANLAPSAIGKTEGELGLDGTDASIHRLSAALDRAAVARLLAMGEPGTPDSALFNFVVHGAAYVGEAIVREHGGSWGVREPLWESVVQLTSRAGEAELAVFHWWLKSLAPLLPGAEDAGPHVTLADRYRAHVEVPCAAPESLPVLAPPERKLPKLAKVRYDSFYKYLRANLPELRDVGEDFPSPERFDELGFKSLSFALVGGGRMLVVSGANEHGLHAFWLTSLGFEKSAFWPADAFPEPLLRPKGEDKLDVLLSKDGKAQSFEILWWGP